MIRYINSLAIANASFNGLYTVIILTKLHYFLVNFCMKSRKSGFHLEILIWEGRHIAWLLCHGEGEGVGGGCTPSRMKHGSKISFLANCVFARAYISVNILLGVPK